MNEGPNGERPKDEPAAPGDRPTGVGSDELPESNAAANGTRPLRSDHVPPDPAR
jgi:hypothetical protein